MKVFTKSEDLEMDIVDLLRLFEKDGDDGISLYHEENFLNDICVNTFTIEEGNKKSVYGFENKIPQNLSPLRYKSFRKRFVKNNLYDLMSKLYNKKLPWGALTGIRPTKLARDLIENGEVKEYVVAEYLQKEFRVSEQKAKLVAKTLKNQRGMIRNDNLIDFYVNIPICPSRCMYCSFISNELARVKDKVETYIDCLIKEIHAAKEIIANKSYIVRNIYIGGGTPTVLTAEQLDRLLREITFSVNEFTVECGRPDTITREKLDVLKKYGVTRISINPQTFCDATLKRIGRNHKVEDVISAYAMALEYDFDINMDVIAGLPGEGKGQFTKTINTLLELAPHNLTIHTLSLKNGSLLRDQQDKGLTQFDLQRALQEAEDKVMASGYKPYYLYRQKNQLGGLENVGFFRDENICLFNIDSMEEITTIMAVGANAASKRVFNFENRIERSFNVKFIDDYIRQIDEMVDRKREFFK